MKKKVNIVLLGVLLVAIVFVVMYGRQQKQNAPKYVFTYAENHPENYPTTLGAYRFAELVYERTGGEIQIIVQAEGRLGDEKKVVEQVRFGGIDFARISLSQISDNIPELNALQMPYLYRNSEHMWKVLDGEIGEEVLSYFDGKGMIGLSWYDAGARNFYSTKKPIKTLADMKDMKIRVQESELMMDMVEVLGAKAVALTYEDSYSGLETGIVEAAENNWPSYESSGHIKVAKYYTIDEHTRVPEVQMCSEATWNQLTPEYQKIIRECAKESALYERSKWLEREKESVKIAKDQGVQIIILSAEEKNKFHNAVEVLYQKYCFENMELIDRIRSVE